MPQEEGKRNVKSNEGKDMVLHSNWNYKYKLMVHLPLKVFIFWLCPLKKPGGNDQSISNDHCTVQIMSLSTNFQEKRIRFLREMTDSLSGIEHSEPGTPRHTTRQETYQR